MPSALDPQSVARFLSQQVELGITEWIIESRSASEVIRDLAEAAERWRDGSLGCRERSFGAVRGGTAPPAAELGSDQQRSAGGYEELKGEALSCQRCRLAQGRSQVVFSDGNPQGRVMVVGEAPGANEDRTGLPFVGAAGKLLDLLLASIDLSREESVYICNVIKCRPPGNRNPRPDEIDACAPFLRRQIASVRPEAILAVGTFAAQLLAGVERPLGKLRGEVYAYEGIPLIVTYHPAALLRNPGWTKSSWVDLQLLRDVIDGS